jgi:hypothetical protein
VALLPALGRQKTTDSLRRGTRLSPDPPSATRRLSKGRWGAPPDIKRDRMNHCPPRGPGAGAAHEGKTTSTSTGPFSVFSPKHCGECCPHSRHSFRGGPSLPAWMDAWRGGSGRVGETWGNLRQMESFSDSPATWPAGVSPAGSTWEQAIPS